MGRADDFRAKAIECDKLADEAWDPETKQMLQETAKKWRVLAVQAMVRGALLVIRASSAKWSGANDNLEMGCPPLPPCPRCDGPYRLVKIEGTDKPHQDLYTFECPGCGALETRTVRVQ